MNFFVVIPSRFAAVRLPGKPLLDLAGKPMIQHVWERACESGAQQVIVATDDERIAAACRGFGAQVCITDGGHVSGSDRIAEVTEQLGWSAQAVVVNLQGDEPLMPAINILQVAELLHLHRTAELATLCTPIRDTTEFLDPGVVKVVHNAEGRALYFSRQAIPAVRDSAGSVPPGALRHLGLYAYRVSALRRLAAAPACELEQAERLEQLRALWMGMTIQVDVARAVAGPGVDTQADAAKVAALLARR